MVGRIDELGREKVVKRERSGERKMWRKKWRKKEVEREVEKVESGKEGEWKRGRGRESEADE